MITTATRTKRISTQFFAGLNTKIAAMKARGQDVIRLDVGSPDLPPPAPVIEALYRSASTHDHHGYQAYNATPDLRQAWAEMYRRLYNVELNPDTEVVPLLGSKEGIFHLTQALVESGDVVLVPDPGYLTYPQAARFAGGIPYSMPLLPERNFIPNLEEIPSDIAQKAKILWLNYPNNPTAATASLEFFEQAVKFAQKFDCLLCHDAAYNQVTFDDYQAPSLMQVPGAKNIALEFNTLSKSHNMAGWRVGVAVGQSETLRALYTVKTNTDSGHFLPILDAATAALSGDQSWIEVRNQIYRQRRDVVIQALSKIGSEVPIPQASLYVWIPVPEGWSSIEFTNAVLENALVSLTPGPVFGQHGEGFIRIALTAPEERLVDAMQRLTHFIISNGYIP
jgi:LL-diaminopimelate aminotransferase